jgi:hypothetical protein
MKGIRFTLLLVSTVTIAGCVSEKEARRREVKAYWTGQQQQQQQQQNGAQTSKFSVYVMGNVVNHTVPWTIDLTLAKALISASYLGEGIPKTITVTRNGETINIDPVQLLRGYDFPLEAGDRIELTP